MISLALVSLFSTATADPAAVCSEICVYYTHRLAPSFPDKKGVIRKTYQPYTDCIVSFAKSFDLAGVVSKNDVQRFMDQAWVQCAAERDSGDSGAIAFVKALPNSDPAQVEASVSAKRAMWAYILSDVIFQKAGHGPQMNEYIKDMRSKLAPELDKK